MLDATVMRALAAPMNAMGRQLVRTKLTPNHITVLGFGFGLACCVAVTQGLFVAAACLFALNRLCDGLDGALARATRSTDLGGYLDIVADFIFYAGFICAFAVYDPSNAIAAAVLLTAFMGTGSSFLAYAIIAAKRREQTDTRGPKAFYYLGGLAEGTETVIAFALMLIWPAGFTILAYGFAGLCALTVIGRVLSAVRDFGTPS